MTESSINGREMNSTFEKTVHSNKIKTHICGLKSCVIHGDIANTLRSYKLWNFILVTLPVIGHVCLWNKLIMQIGHLYSAVNS